MDPELFEDTLSRCLFDAGRGSARDAKRAAELFELIDRESDAAMLWRFAAALGDQGAIDYCADFVDGDRITAGGGASRDEVLDEVRRSRLEDLASLADRFASTQDVFAAALSAIHSTPVCAIHRTPEPDRPGDYRTCGECLHVWRTEADFVADERRARREHGDAMLRYEGGRPPPDTSDPRAAVVCPLCTHDF